MAALYRDEGSNSRANTRIRVALTTTIDPNAGSHARPAVFLYTSYIDALESFGLAPLLVTPAHDAASIDALLGACCGLVLSGGEDVHPLRYGEEPSPALGHVEPLRDEMEFAAVAAAVARGMPVFGICRGLQVLNVHFGGTLYQDIATDRPGEQLRHLQTQPWGERSHGARVRPGSLLSRIVGEERLQINSFHHQAVKHLAKPMKVTARADDGLVEAIEHTDYPWMLGVQWHPERNEAAAPDTDPDRRLFQGFAAAVAEYRQAGKKTGAGTST